MTIKQMAATLRMAASWAEWESDVLEDFHAYAQRFGLAGTNVFELVLKDALAHRGLTLDQLRAVEAQKAAAGR